ncbi:MAG: hypothetical protein ACE5KD_04820, partial [Candidatus Bathyarchaeia archaeon]
MVDLEFALEIVRILFSFVLIVVSWKLYNFFKPGIMYRQWLFLILGAVINMLASVSAVLDELGVAEVAHEKALCAF